jgi:hypothetical protein
MLKLSCKLCTYKWNLRDVAHQWLPWTKLASHMVQGSFPGNSHKEVGLLVIKFFFNLPATNKNL